MLDDLRQTRIDKIQKLQALGLSTYVSAPAATFRTLTSKQIKDGFEKYDGKVAKVVGKVMLLREIGKIAFATIQDETEKIQLFFKESDIETGSSDDLSNTNQLNDEPTHRPTNSLTHQFTKTLKHQPTTTLNTNTLSNVTLSYSNLDLLDIGDYIQAEGEIGKTKTGEISIMVKRFTLLSKSVRPMPEKFHGIQDIETKLRKRYLDLVTDPELRELFRKKAQFWQVIREFLVKEGFTEVTTSIMEEVTGGADANPFVTHHNALDEDFYLRISPELHLKRLIGGGYEKVFEIGPCFRNEGIDEEHLQEFWNMEFYWAYANYRDNMELNKRMYREIAKKVFGKSVFTMKGFEVDFEKEWEEIDFVEVIKEKLGVDVLNDPEEKLKATLKENGAKYEEKATRERLADLLWKIIRKTIAGPAFLVNEPVLTSPLARVNDANPLVTERFHIIIAGSELGNGYTELIDPIDQLQRFEKQQALRDAGDEEAQMLDYDFVEMLEYGMPPTTGFGMGERLFSFMVDLPMRTTTFFPQMGRKK